MAVEPTTQPNASPDYAHVLNLQIFEEGLGGVFAPGIVASDNAQKPFMVENQTFADFESAANHACDVQMAMCTQVCRPTRTRLP
jgi:hypothetical protein